MIWSFGTADNLFHSCTDTKPLCNSGALRHLALIGTQTANRVRSTPHGTTDLLPHHIGDKDEGNESGRLYGHYKEESCFFFFLHHPDFSVLTHHTIFIGPKEYTTLNSHERVKENVQELNTSFSVSKLNGLEMPRGKSEKWGKCESAADLSTPIH